MPQGHCVHPAFRPKTDRVLPDQESLIVTQVSVLNLVPVRQGQSAAQAFASMIELARAVESFGYHRYWIAEHHNAPHLLSSATQLLIAQTLASTQRIRVGSGGVMLPNHSPLMVAEQFGTLATFHPGRVDLGVGRAPGTTDNHTMMALRRNIRETTASFPEDVRTLQSLFADEEPANGVLACPGRGLRLPLYMLGSSNESAYLAADMGLPYVFGAHFAPKGLERALATYREAFRPSPELPQPKVIVCLNAIVAETDEEADHLATTQQQFFLNAVRNGRQPLMPPVASMEGLWSDGERAAAEPMMACSLIGSRERVAEQYRALQARISADELMVVSYIFDEQKQHHSYRLFQQVVAAQG